MLFLTFKAQFSVELYARAENAVSRSRLSAHKCERRIFSEIKNIIRNTVRFRKFLCPVQVDQYCSYIILFDIKRVN